jgi:hypothetical protein
MNDYRIDLIERGTRGMKFKRRSPCLFLAALVLLMLPTATLAQVSVYAEGAYTATDLAVYIYADIAAGNPLCSYGVKLSYDTGRLTVATATKNEEVWYFGTTAVKQPYMNPDFTSESGKIIFIGGKLDTSSPTSPRDGVIGTRVLLGKATFNRVGGDTAFGITLGLGKTHPPFDNFVTSVAPATVLDGSITSFAVTIHERGDADGNGVININDVRTLRQLIGDPNAGPWVDCDGDGAVTINDVRCLRQKF